MKEGIAAGALALALLAVPATAGELNRLGDGSDYNNADLTRDSTADCENCAPTPPDEGGDAPFDLDWSLGLRGGIENDGTGDGSTYVMIALPSFTLRHETIRGGYDVGLKGELTYEVDGSVRIGSITGTVGGEYQFDALTTLAGRADFTVSEDDPDSPDNAPNVAAAPQVVTGNGEASVTRDLGTFNVALRGSAGRQIYGETVYDDNSTSNNDFQNTTALGGGVRLGYELTPGLVAFVDGEAGYLAYDAPSPSLLVKLDNVSYAGRGGLSARFNETLELEGSLGLGYTDLTEGSLPDFSAVLYDAKATFRPDETLALAGTFSTSISQPGTTSGATAKLTYAALGEAEYQVNPWLKLRAAAQWSEAHYQGVDADEYKWGFGTGADYLFNEHTDLTADYSFLRTETTPEPATNEHKVTLGVTFHK